MSTPTSPEPPGSSRPKKVGPYRVTGRLGQGGMGEVLRGHDDRLDRPVALKRLHRTDDDARRRFRREAQAVAKLRHPCIVQVYDWVEDGDTDWMVMELVDGLGLQEALEYSHPTLPQILHVARRLAEGLMEAHDAGLIHRDLKASNVMLDSAFERVWILDFGIAKSFHPQDGMSTLTGDGGIVGTVHNMSPEQALGQPLDPRSDLFSLGVLLYEMIGGENPFATPNPVETLSRICSWQQPSLSSLDPSVPEGISELVDRLLKKDRKHRPADAREVLRALAVPPKASESREADLEVDEPRTASGDSTLFDLAQAKLPRKPSGILAALTLALVLIGGAGAWKLVRNPMAPGVAPSAVGPSTMPTSTVPTSTPPQDDLTPAELTRRGMQRLERYDREGNIASAIDDFQKALSADPEFAPALAGLAKGYWLDYRNANQELARLEQAASVAHRAVELDPFLAQSWVHRGMIQVDRHQFEAAENDLERALEIEPLNADAWYGLAKVAEARSEGELAEQRFKKAIELRPTSWIYPSALGKLYFSQGQYDRAEEAFLKSLANADGNYMGHRNLGTTYYLQGRLDEAATQLQLALQLHPVPSVYTNLGNIYFSQGLYVDAARAFEKSLEVRVTEHTQWANLGDAYRWIPGAESKAEEAYLQAIKALRQRVSEPNASPTAGTQLALYQSKIGACDQVPQEMAAMDTLARKDPSAWYRLATASEICKQRGPALEALARAVRAGYPMSQVQLDPEFLQLRQDARFHRMQLDEENVVAP